MKKSTLIVSTLVAALTASPFALATGSPVHPENIRFECPNASGGAASERLTNYGTSISGMGEENIGASKKALPIFRGVTTPGIPLDLSTGGYKHDGTLYNNHTGRVTCKFVSTLGADPFNVSYVADNIKHGFVVKSDDKAITIKVFQG